MKKPAKKASRKRKPEDHRLITYTGAGGYDSEKERANKVFVKGQKYRCTGGSMGQSYTSLYIEGIEGQWNSALFNCDIHKMQIPCNFIHFSTKFPTPAQIKGAVSIANARTDTVMDCSEN